MKLSIVIPAVNETGNIEPLLTTLQGLRQRGHEIIVVDGGSTDGTTTTAHPWCDQCLVSERGRAVQMRAGARVASGDILWFLHADSIVPPRADELIAQALSNTAGWGGFPVRLSGRRRLLRIVARLMNIRSRMTGILTGDQGIFVTRDLFDRVGGFQAIPLMEDIDLSARLKRVMRPVFTAETLGTSSRRWESGGIVRVIVRMWLLRAAYYFGVPAHYLAAYYGITDVSSSRHMPGSSVFQAMDSGVRRNEGASRDALAEFRYPTARIIVFARAPEHGKVKTRLAAGIGADAALAVYRQLLEQTITTVAASRLAPIELHITGDPQHPFVQSLARRAGAAVVAQQGDDLGERMYYALDTVLQHCESALLIGTDCPVMDETYLERALQHLAGETEVVIGPSEDGGYVLIGATRAEAQVFDNIHWSSDRVMQQTRDALHHTGMRYSELEVLWDVDHPDDYRRWQKSAVFRQIIDSEHEENV